MKEPWSLRFVLREVVLRVVVYGALGMAALTLFGKIERKPDVKSLTYTIRVMNACQAANQAYLQRTGNWPANWMEVVSSPNIPDSDNFHLTNQTPVLDGWNHLIQFTPFDAELGYGEFTSFGKDGEPGGVGWNQDRRLRFAGTNVVLIHGK